MNPNNFGSFTGNLAAKPVIFPHEGRTSGTVQITAYVRNNFTSKDGKVHSQKLTAEMYVEDVNKPGIVGSLDTGALVSVAYELKSQEYTDRNGVKQYTMVADTRNSKISPLESKGAAEDRRARTAAYKAQNQAQNQPQAAQAQALVQNQAPVQAQAPVNYAQAPAPAVNYATQGAPAVNYAAQG